MRVKSSDKDAEAWVSLSATRNDGSVVKMSSSKHAAGNSKEWIWLDTRLTAPEGSERISVALHTKGPRGEACFDDVYLGIVQEKK